MKKFILLFLFTLLIGACGYAQRDVDGNIVAPNFQDSTWSSCTYSKDGRSFTPPPVQMGGAPMGYAEEDGTKVMCVPIK